MHDERDNADPDGPGASAAEQSGLDEEQDGRLRTLTGLSQLGRLSPEMADLRRSYRQKDQRATVRPPDRAVVHPVELD